MKSECVLSGRSVEDLLDGERSLLQVRNCILRFSVLGRSDIRNEIHIERQRHQWKERLKW